MYVELAGVGVLFLFLLCVGSIIRLGSGGVGQVLVLTGMIGVFPHKITAPHTYIILCM
jgi:hypothetical protein